MIRTAPRRTRPASAPGRPAAGSRQGRAAVPASPQHHHRLGRQSHPDRVAHRDAAVLARREHRRQGAVAHLDEDLDRRAEVAHEGDPAGQPAVAARPTTTSSGRIDTVPSPSMPGSAWPERRGRPRPGSGWSRR